MRPQCLRTARKHPRWLTLLRIAKMVSGHRGNDGKMPARPGILSSVFSILLIEAPNFLENDGTLEAAQRIAGRGRTVEIGNDGKMPARPGILSSVFSILLIEAPNFLENDGTLEAAQRIAGRGRTVGECRLQVNRRPEMGIFRQSYATIRSDYQRADL